MSKTAFLFPGQGSQTVGMGEDLYQHSPKARSVFDTFNKIANPKLSTICFSGPEEELKRTLYTQPGILATSIAALEAFQEKCTIKADYTAGHSLGEYGALYYANAFGLETAAKLIQKRAELMENAPKGTMAAVLNLSQEVIEQTLSQITDKGPVGIANYNTPNQVIISGTVEGVEAASPLLKEAGAKRVLPLNVGGAFHSSLMDKAAQEFSQFIDPFEFNDTSTPVITNVDAVKESTGKNLRIKLGQQINHPVLWTQTMTHLFEQCNVTTVIEFGPGNVLTGMVKKTYPDIKILNVSDMASLESAVNTLSEAVVS